MNTQTDLRPHFVDNRYGNTPDASLRTYLRALREGRQQFVFADSATVLHQFLRKKFVESIG